MITLWSVDRITGPFGGGPGPEGANQGNGAQITPAPAVSGHQGAPAAQPPAPREPAGPQTGGPKPAGVGFARVEPGGPDTGREMPPAAAGTMPLGAPLAGVLPAL